MEVQTKKLYPTSPIGKSKVEQKHLTPSAEKNECGWLSEAIKELNECSVEAIEEGIPLAV